MYRVIKTLHSIFYVTTCCLLCMNALAEGTPQVMPNPLNGVAVSIDNATLVGPYRGAIAQNRLRFQIKDHTVENLYFSLRAFNRATTPAQVQPYYRIVNSLGTEVVAPTQINNAQQISTYAQTVAGPNIGGAVPSGYTPLVFDPSANDEYYIEIYTSSNAGLTPIAAQQTILTLFDFTVATSSNTRFPGRINCQAWSFITYDPSNNVTQINNSLEGDFYCYGSDSTVSKVDFQNGFRPFGFVLYMNRYGSINGSNWQNDRRSQNTGSTIPSLPNGYPVFLNTPDPTVFTVSAVASAPVASGKIYGCSPNLYIPFYVDKPGDVALLLDINGVAGYQSGTSDRYIYVYDAVTGNNIAAWDGKDGQGNTLASNVSLNLSILIRRGRTNLPIYDAELNTNGMTVSGISPVTFSPRIYWNDILLANDGAVCNTSNQNNNTSGGGIDNSAVGSVSTGRAWDGAGAGLTIPAPTGGGGSATLNLSCDDYGNVRTINTWFYSYEVSSSAYTAQVPVCNADNDPVADGTDIDDDNDGITDLTECGGADPDADADSDGIPNSIDLTPGSGVPSFSDADNNGVSDVYDTDGDGVVNSKDLDSDNDGIADIVEAGGVDTEGDGRIDGIFTDTDGDGLENRYDVSTGGNTIANRDTDGEGVVNAQDLDSDNDGIPDVVEAGGTDADNDGKIDGFTDTDTDGFSQNIDGDTNNDGTADNTAASLIITGADGNNDGAPESYLRANADRLGLPNPYDLDSDNDGIPDVREAGLTDADGDGLADGISGSDGWSDAVDALATLGLLQTDSDGRPDYLDIDSDNDGLTDNVEAQSTAAYQLPSGLDSDNDGLDNVYDNNDAVFGGNAANGIIPVNTDAIDQPDYRDTDSDNDGASDLREGTGNASAVLTNTADSDGDGLADQFDIFDLLAASSDIANNVTISEFGAGGSATGPSPAGSNVIANKTPGAAPDRDWRNGFFVLPVTFVDVSLKYTDNVYQVTWTVTDEVEVKEYIIERSTNGSVFTVAGAVPYRNGGSGLNRYSFTDISFKGTGAVYYRIRQADRNGRYSYSKIVSLRAVRSSNDLLVSGNPVSGDQLGLTIVSAEAGTVSLQLSDWKGSTLIRQKMTVVAGDNPVRMSLTNLPLSNGTYIIQAAINGERVTKKLLIQR